jgi:hypothetical protein
LANCIPLCDSLRISTVGFTADPEVVETDKLILRALLPLGDIILGLVADTFAPPTGIEPCDDIRLSGSTGAAPVSDEGNGEFGGRVGAAAACARALPRDCRAYKSAATVNTAAPPTTPPTIAPRFEEVADGAGDALGPDCTTTAEVTVVLT